MLGHGCLGEFVLGEFEGEVESVVPVPARRRVTSVQSSHDDHRSPNVSSASRPLNSD